MFDYNPFREFKQMMAESNRDRDAAKKIKKIRDRIDSHADSSELLAGLKSDSKFAKDVGNHSDHLHGILGKIVDERGEKGHGPGTRFSPDHDELIKFVMQAPAYHPIEHGNIIHDMEHKIHDQPFSGPARPDPEDGQDRRREDEAIWEMFDNNLFREFKQMMKENTEIVPMTEDPRNHAHLSSVDQGVRGFNFEPLLKPTENADKVHNILTNPDSTPEDLDVAAQILRVGDEVGRDKKGGQIYKYANGHLHATYLPLLRRHRSYDRLRHYV